MRQIRNARAHNVWWKLRTKPRWPSRDRAFYTFALAWPCQHPLSPRAVYSDEILRILISFVEYSPGFSPILRRLVYAIHRFIGERKISSIPRYYARFNINFVPTGAFYDLGSCSFFATMTSVVCLQYRNTLTFCLGPVLGGDMCSVVSAFHNQGFKSSTLKSFLFLLQHHSIIQVLRCRKK